MIGMLNIINFSEYQMKPLLFNLITQTILPFNELTMNISEGDRFGVGFNNTQLKDYSLIVTKVTFTNMKKITNEDIFKNGFLYKPSFLNYMKNFRNVENDSSIVKLDFKLIGGIDL